MVSTQPQEGASCTLRLRQTLHQVPGGIPRLKSELRGKRFEFLPFSLFLLSLRQDITWPRVVYTENGLELLVVLALL